MASNTAKPVVRTLVKSVMEGRVFLYRLIKIYADAKT